MPPYDTDKEPVDDIIDDINDYLNKKDLDSGDEDWYDYVVAMGETLSDDDLYELGDFIMRTKQRLTAEQRAQFARDRQALIGSLITQKGEFCGALVKEHVRGSQYVVRLANGTEVYASHKKRVEGQRGLSKGGWRVWEDR
jgi:hypothetical protein